jgi:hypothetical protein
MARKKLPPELKAKNHTFKLYDWEVEAVKKYIKDLRLILAGQKQPVALVDSIKTIPINVEVEDEKNKSKVFVR